MTSAVLTTAPVLSKIRPRSEAVIAWPNAGALDNAKTRHRAAKRDFIRSSVASMKKVPKIESRILFGAAFVVNVIAGSVSYQKTTHYRVSASSDSGVPGSRPLGRRLSDGCFKRR